jgi:hypothetical protein
MPLAPPWFGPAIQIALQPLTALISQLNSKIFNANALRSNDPISPLVNNYSMYLHALNIILLL